MSILLLRWTSDSSQQVQQHDMETKETCDCNYTYLKEIYAYHFNKYT